MKEQDDLERYRMTIDEYLALMEEDPLPEAAMSVLREILAEIKSVTPSFIAQTGTLAKLAEEHSDTFRALPEDRKRSYNSIFGGPIFFVYD
ncbi:hypothetical protein ACQJ0H_21770 [Pantoea agglomerans]|uniref:hypothetical protein n=1 Tax=Enterobacter agglomerans TaxID=549 RepID=UPI003CFB84CE